LTEGFPFEMIPVTVPDWRVPAEAALLNKPATEQVMADLRRGYMRPIVQRATRRETAVDLISCQKGK